MGELVWLQIDHGQPVGEGAETSTDWYQSFGGSRRWVETLVSSAGSSQEIQRLGERPCGFRIWIPPSSASFFSLGSTVSSSGLASASVSKDWGSRFTVDKLKPFTYWNLYLGLFLLKINNRDINVFLEV